MRFKLTAEFLGKSPYILPINYQYELSAWLYKIIHRGDKDFAVWLHKHGYMDSKRQYKLFTFSNLSLDKFRAQNDRLIIENPEAKLIVSFYAGEAAEPFIKGLFMNSEGSIGDKQSRVNFRITNVETLPVPSFNDEQTFNTLSPLVVSKLADSMEGKPKFLSPEDDNFEEILFQNLVNKYTAWLLSAGGKEKTINLKTSNNFSFKLLNKPKSRLITIKSGTEQQTKVRGYMFRFSLKAPVDILKLGYQSGFGEKNSLGFGCVEI